MAAPANHVRRIIKWTALSAAAALAVTGCTSGDGGAGNGSDTGPGDGSGGGGTIVFQMGGDPNIVNPTMTTGFADQQLGCTIFEGLTISSPDGLPLPRLAHDWEISEDGLEYTFHLVEANWHDGEPFTSEDVKFTYENFSAVYGPIWGDLGQLLIEVETPNPRTAVLKLSDPFAPTVLMTQCSHSGAILPKHIYEGIDPSGPELREITPIGTGPFMWTEATPGQSYILDANTDYWQEGLPKADRLIGQVIADTASAVSALRAGEIDYINVLPANASNQLSGVDGIVVQESELPQATNQYLFFNTQREPFSNPEVRKALYQAIDRDYIVDHVYFGRGKPGVSSMTDVMWAYTGDVDYSEMYPFDADGAAAALDEAGYPEVDGTRFSLDFLVRNDPPERIELANVIAAMWDQIGIDVNVRVLERAAENVEAFQEFNFDANIQGLSNYADPAAGSARAFICDSIGRNFGNPGQFCDPEIDALWAEASRVTDTDERAAIYGQIDIALAEQLPTPVLVQEASENARVENLKGLRIQSASPDWSEAYLE